MVMRTLDDNMKVLDGRTVLVTGGTGSFGCKFVTRVLASQAKEIRIYSRDEKKQYEMKNRFGDLTYIVGDTRDRVRVDEAMRGVDLVFHAAALKQVPSCEDSPIEAVKTNILGSNNVFQAAINAGVECVVALSTDKAVKPVNVMGMSKALMERVACAYDRGQKETRLCCVRYGNVMGSRGSVIPLFMERIRAGRPLSLTVPSMTRFLMSLDESVGLVLHAMERSRGGEVFVRKAPACTVESLAKAMCARWSPSGAQHPIVVEGSRRGEKLHEVLVNEYEMLRAVECDDYYVVGPDGGGTPSTSRRPGCVEYTSENTRQITDLDELARLVENALASVTFE